MAIKFPGLKNAKAVAPSPQKVSDSSPVEFRHAEERRIAERHHASLLPSITGVRLSPSGGEASLVNISTTGVLLKANVRLMPGTIVTVNLDGTFQPASIAGRVVRCMVTDIDSKGVLCYHVGAAFNQEIAIDGLPVTTNAAPAPQPLETRTSATISKNRW
jgi:hypothetical protein